MSDTVKYRATGLVPRHRRLHRQSRSCGEEADPYEDLSARGLLLWEPSDGFRADLRAYISDVATQALYFNITESVNDTSLPVRVNNRGVNERDMSGASLKLDCDARRCGTLTSVTAYDKLEEILTGDQFNFLPIPESVLFQFFGGRPGAAPVPRRRRGEPGAALHVARRRRVRWIVGAYAIATDRFISTGNVIDIGDGIVPEVRRTPLPKFDIPTNCFPPACRQFTYLADSQDNFAWAVFGDLSFDITDKLEGSLALRYDEDERENTTETPANFLPTPDCIPGPGAQAHLGRAAAEGDACATSPPTIARCTSATAAASAAAVSTRPASARRTLRASSDLFDKETADTYEAGFKGEFMDRRLATNLSLYYTQANGSYFFVFDPNTSTQNLGNLGEVDYKGLELELAGARRPTASTPISASATPTARSRSPTAPRPTSATRRRWFPSTASTSGCSIVSSWRHSAARARSSARTST